jgi:hypothetical protein
MDNTMNLSRQYARGNSRTLNERTPVISSVIDENKCLAEARISNNGMIDELFFGPHTFQIHCNYNECLR